MFFLYQWVFELVDLPGNLVGFKAELWNPEDKRYEDLQVWEELPDLNGLGITARDDSGLVDIDVQAVSQNQLEISAVLFFGLTTFVIPPQIRLMTSLHRGQSAGGVQSVFFPRECPDALTTVYLRVVDGGGSLDYTLTGDVDTGVFTSPSGWILSWISGTANWRLNDPIAGFAFSAAGNRCNPSGVYMMVGVWAGNVQIVPF